MSHINDYQRIIGMIEIAAMRTKIPDAVDRLLTNLKGARMLPQENISGDIITMNSRARLTELSSGKEIEITVTYPQDADNLLKKDFSLLTYWYRSTWFQGRRYRVMESAFWNWTV